MKRLILFVAVSFITLYSVGQSDQPKAVRSVSGFHGVDVSGGIDLFISSGSESVYLTASDATVLPLIKTVVKDGILHIYLDENFKRGRHDSKMQAYVSLSKLTSLGASGGSDILFQNEITAEDLNVGLSGGSNLKGKLNANHLTINQSGGSDVDLSGNVKNLDVEASGGSELAGYGLAADYIRIRASGGSESRITANKELNVVVSGGSEVYYKGGATVREIKSSGSSTVSHKD